MSLKDKHVILGNGRFALTIKGELFRVAKSNSEDRAILNWQYSPHYCGDNRHLAYYYKVGKPRLNINVHKEVKINFGVDLSKDNAWRENINKNAKKNNEKALEENRKVVKKEKARYHKRSDRRDDTKKEEVKKEIKADDCIEKPPNLLGISTHIPGVVEHSAIFNPFPL